MWHVRWDTCLIVFVCVFYFFCQFYFYAYFGRFGIGATIHTRQEIQYLPYAGFSTLFFAVILWLLDSRTKLWELESGKLVEFSKHRPSGPMLSISWNVRLRVRQSVGVFNFEVLFKRLFSPTSWSHMSYIFRDSESLGKSNGKKAKLLFTLFLLF